MSSPVVLGLCACYDRKFTKLERKLAEAQRMVSQASKHLGNSTKGVSKPEKSGHSKQE